MRYKTTIITQCTQCCFKSRKKAVLTEDQLQWAREHDTFTERCPRCNVDGSLSIIEIAAAPKVQTPAEKNKGQYVTGVSMPAFWRYKKEGVK